MFKSGSITVSYSNTYPCFQFFPLAIHLRKELDWFDSGLDFFPQECCIGDAGYFLWHRFGRNMFGCSIFGDLKIDRWALGVSCPIRFPTHLPPNSCGNHWWLLFGSIISLGVAEQGFSDPIRTLCHLWFFYKELKWDRWDIYFWNELVPWQPPKVTNEVFVFWAGVSPNRFFETVCSEWVEAGRDYIWKTRMLRGCVRLEKIVGLGPRGVGN